jgi:hypothetical protein
MTNSNGRHSSGKKKMKLSFVVGDAGSSAVFSKYCALWLDFLPFVCAFHLIIHFTRTFAKGTLFI